MNIANKTSRADWQMRSLWARSSLETTAPASFWVITSFGSGLVSQLQEAARLKSGAMVFAYEVRDPERYGVIEFDGDGKAISLEEKPKQPKSNYAVPGLYFYDRNVVKFAESLKPSARGEIEITDLNRIYLERGELRVSILGRGVAWLDAGTHDSAAQSANFIQAVQDRQVDDLLRGRDCLPHGIHQP